MDDEKAEVSFPNGKSWSITQFSELSILQTNKQNSLAEGGTDLQYYGSDFLSPSWTNLQPYIG